MTIAITGVSGPLGRAAAEHVLRTVDPPEVVLLTRRPEAVADLAARGAQARHADFDDPASLASALRGTDRLLIVSTDAIGRRVPQHRAAIDAALAAGVSHIAYTSVPRPVSANPSLVVPDHEATEAAIVASGVTWTFLRNNMYAHMQVPGLEHAATSGRWVTNTGDGGVAYVTRDDAAAAAAAVLTSAGHQNVAYDITGPTAWTGDELAALAATRPAAAGRDVQVVHVDDRAFAAGLREAGLPDPLVELLTSIGASARAGYLEAVSSSVTDLTGSAAATLNSELPEASSVR